MCGLIFRNRLPVHACFRLRGTELPLAQFVRFYVQRKVNLRGAVVIHQVFSSKPVGSRFGRLRALRWMAPAKFRMLL